ncbi:hypothetical protein [Clostridium polynesiense]|uniref:hypothetical protein n=1 Tax=Clostridium polynesiense TaxID=1325933 RepID=UPI00058E0A06|nr:hypothetical protein [Clostridium polynesiense]
MLTLIGNEFRKLLSRKKTYVVFLGFAAFMSLMVYAKYRENKNIEYYNSPEVRLQQMQESINHFNDRMKEIDKELKKEDISEKVRTELNVEKRYYTEDIERVKNSMKPLEEAIKTGKNRIGELI